jgi:deoxyinosine 3'endonuclease (endonuclease V)
MFACVDTHYFDWGSRTALLQFRDWEDAAAERATICEHFGEAAEYVPGQFYLRELPCITDVLERSGDRFETIVVDGYVYLDQGRAGLGKRLFDLLQGQTSVIGVAKNPFRKALDAQRVLRRGSRRPLFVTAIGLPVATAATLIDRMHGEFRNPTLLKQVDALARKSVNSKKSLS